MALLESGRAAQLKNRLKYCCGGEKVLPLSLSLTRTHTQVTIENRLTYYCGAKAVDRGIFHLPQLDPIKPPKYVSVRSQQVITLVLSAITFWINYLVRHPGILASPTVGGTTHAPAAQAIRIAIFTNDVCDGAPQVRAAGGPMGGRRGVCDCVLVRGGGGGELISLSVQVFAALIMLGIIMSFVIGAAPARPPPLHMARRPRGVWVLLVALRNV
jgi:hypothetical protein